MAALDVQKIHFDSIMMHFGNFARGNEILFSLYLLRISYYPTHPRQLVYTPLSRHGILSLTSVCCTLSRQIAVLVSLASA